MKLIIGLGNPGKNYESTRHNIGFMVIDKYAAKYNLNAKEKFNGIHYVDNVNGEKFIFLKPQSFMNLSGGVVKKYIDFFKINLKDIVVICDDLDLPVSKIRLRQTGSSGGHNGLKDIELNIKSKDYKRIKIGISNDKTKDTKDFVLGKFSLEEKKLIDESINTALNIIDDFKKEDFIKLMNKYN